MNTDAHLEEALNYHAVCLLSNDNSSNEMSSSVQLLSITYRCFHSGKGIFL